MKKKIIYIEKLILNSFTVLNLEISYEDVLMILLGRLNDRYTDAGKKHLKKRLKDFNNDKDQ